MTALLNHWKIVAGLLLLLMVSSVSAMRFTPHEVLESETQPIQWNTIVETNSSTPAVFTNWVESNSFGIDPYYDNGWVITTSPRADDTLTRWGSVETRIFTTYNGQSINQLLGQSKYIRLGFTVKPLGGDTTKLPTIRFRLNRIGGPNTWKISESTFIFPRNMKNSWSNQEERTFYLTVALEDYPISSSVEVATGVETNTGILAAVDLIIPKGEPGNNLSGGVRLTKFTIDKSDRSIGAVERVFRDDFRSGRQEWALENYTALTSFDSSYSEEDEGYTFKINQVYGGYENQSNIQMGSINKNEPVIFEGSDLYRYSAQFSKYLPTTLNPTTCKYGPYIRMRMNSKDWSYAHERYYFSMDNSFPLDYPAQANAIPLQLFFSPTEAAPLTSERNFRFSIDALNYSTENCVGSSFTIHQATVGRLTSFTDSVRADEMEE